MSPKDSAWPSGTLEVPFRCIRCRASVAFAEQVWSCPGCGETYPLQGGVHRFMLPDLSATERKVEQCYSFLWSKLSTMEGSENRLQHRRATYALWFGLESREDWSRLFEGKVVLDAGAGCGMADHLIIPHAKRLYAVDLSAGIDVAARFWRDRPKFVPVQASILSMPFADESFDVVFSAGSLHHTRDARQALAACVDKMKLGGRILFYVYKKKSALREYADDLVRAMLEGLEPEEALPRLLPLTLLGRSLSRIEEKVIVEKAVPELGLKRGIYTLHDLVHWHLMGAFWSPLYSLSENLRVNFDWYFPRLASRHEPREVWSWLDELDLYAERFRTTESGISVVARRRSESDRAPRS